MDRNTVYTKTAKGITQVNQRSASLSKDLMKVLKLIDGKSNFGQLLDKADVDKGQLEKALITLAKDGYARVFETRKEEADPFAADDDFDFTAAGKMPASTQRVVAGAANDIGELVRQQEKADAARKSAAQAQAQEAKGAENELKARLKEEIEARMRSEMEDLLKTDVEEQTREQMRAEIMAEVRLAAKAELEDRIRAERETLQHAELEARTKADHESRARAENEAKLRAQ